MHTVRDLLQVKGGQVWSIAPESTVYAALELMAEKNCGALVVIQDGKVVGIPRFRDHQRA